MQLIVLNNDVACKAINNRLPSPTAYPRQDMKKSQGLLHWPLSSSSSSLSAFSLILMIDFVSVGLSSFDYSVILSILNILLANMYLSAFC